MFRYQFAMTYLTWSPPLEWLKSEVGKICSEYGIFIDYIEVEGSVYTAVSSLTMAPLSPELERDIKNFVDSHSSGEFFKHLVRKTCDECIS